MDKTQRHAFKLQLAGERIALLAQLAQLRGGEVGRAQASAAHFSGAEDPPAQRATERDLELALDEHETLTLSQIDAALARIETGVYGECLDCGQDIGLARLTANPRAMRCIACQQRAEAESGS